jgi:hypothetical protein
MNLRREPVPIDMDIMDKYADKYAAALLAAGPYAANEIRRIWKFSESDARIVIILTSSGFHRFTVHPEHPQYEYYKAILSTARDGGWVTTE